MPVHIIKLVVGVKTIDELQRWGEARVRESGQWRTPTRSTPRRATEVLDGGSLYRVIGGQILVRQQILAIETTGAGREARCAFVVAPALIRTAPTPRRPFQGWRYLQHSDAPPDLDAGVETGEASLVLLRSLRDLGVW